MVSLFTNGKVDTIANLPRMPESIFSDYHVAHSDRHTFVNYQQLRSLLQQRFREFDDGGTQYVAIDKIDMKFLEQVERSRSKLPKMRLYYDSLFEELIIKFVSPKHDIATRLFSREFLARCQSNNITHDDYTPLGSGRHESTTARSKEPDDGFKPKATRPYYDDKPTLVIEASLSESLNKLRTDAHFWLANTDRRVKVVVLIHIKRDNTALHIEKWQMEEHLRPRGSRTERPNKIQEFDIINNSGAVRPATPLEVSLDLLFDVKPTHITGTEIQTPSTRLQYFAQQYFEGTRTRPQDG